MVSVIIHSILPIFIIIIVGVFAGKKKIINFSHSKSLVNYITTFALPAILFSSTATTPLKDFSDIKVLISITLGFTSIFLLTHFIFFKYFKIGNKKSTILALSSSFPNSTFVGIPILLNFYGSQVLTPIIIMTIISSVLLIPLGLILLESDKIEFIDVFRHLFKVLKNPMIFMPLLGLIFSGFHINIPSVIESSCNLLGGTAPTVALFTMGVRMSNYKLTLSKSIALTIFFKNLLSPLVFFILLFLFKVDKTLIKEIVVISAIPTATIVPMMASQYNILELEANSASILGTFSSLFSLGFLIYITQ